MPYSVSRTKEEVEEGIVKDIAAHFTIINHRGRCLYGAPIKEIFDDVPIRDYIDSIWNDIADAEKDYVEDIYWALCMLNIAIFLRMGLGGAPLSIERAYNVLKMTLEKTKNEGMKENISKELSHYKTGLFGGMKYVE